MRLRLVFAAIFCFGTLLAQNPAEIGLISDNDLYASPVNDQYYTNGIEFFYRYLSEYKSYNVKKRIIEFRAGQYIFNPQSPRAKDIKVHDRPFAGYLFAEAGLNTYFTTESVLKCNFQLGVVGPESYAEQVQEGLHNLVGYHKVEGWEYQITTIPAVQGQVFYSHKIFPGRYHEKVDFHLQGEANTGTIWTGISVGAMARISLKGLLRPMYDTALHNATLSREQERYKDSELFIYLSPNFNYQIYDATIQGSLFNDDSPVTFPILPFRFNAEAGVKYRYHKWNLYYAFNYRGKELSNNVISGYYYGSIGVGFLL